MIASQEMNCLWCDQWIPNKSIWVCMGLSLCVASICAKGAQCYLHTKSALTANGFEIHINIQKWDSIFEVECSTEG